MPPKKAAGKNDPSKKTVEKQKQKVVEDKTFGLKNKKGSKQQKFIQQVQKQVQSQGKTAKQVAKEGDDKDKKKDDKKKQVDELNNLFKPVEQKLAKGVDPKSVLCAFFKAGQCTKGDKCKFSHDLNIGRKGEKRSMYEDTNKADEDTMDGWDEAKLEEVVNTKHGETNKSLPKTTIICKYFLDAVEGNKYGWFWTCPNGEGCHYRHALPPGFVLKKDKKREEEGDKISLEELVEKERAALSSKNLTPVTFQTFIEWKELKRKEKIAALKKLKEQRKQDYSSGKMFGVSGRELFEFNPNLVVNDDEEPDEGSFDLSQYRREDEGDEGAGVIYEIKPEQFSDIKYNEDCSKISTKQTTGGGILTGEDSLCNGNDADESHKLGMAAALEPRPTVDIDAAIALATSAVANDEDELVDMPIDEDLFDADDLLEVDEELETLELTE